MTDVLRAGLVDVHVHIASPDWESSVVGAGISAVREAGTRPSPGKGVERQKKGPSRPVLVSSCWALYKEGGYGTRFGVPVGSPGSIKSEIMRLKEAGADIIKTMASGMVSLKQPGTVTAGGFDGDELEMIVREAAEAGLAVMAHANGEEAIMAAAKAGVRSVEHGFFMTEAALELLARNGVFWVPTTGALIRAANASATTDEARRFVSGLVEHHLRMIGHAHALGVPLAVGTDCVLPDPDYRTAYEAEMGYFRQADLPEDEVLRIATENGSRLLGLQQ